MSIRLACALWASVVFALCATTSGATTIVHHTPADLARESTLVVQGTVVAVTPAWNADRTRIFTEIDVAVGATHKGSTVSSVRVVQLGGVVEPYRMTVSGALRWRVGEEVLLFVEPADLDRYRITGFNQGRFDVVRDGSGPAMVQRATLDGIEWRSSGATRAPDDAGAALLVPLQEFLDATLGEEGGR